MSARVAAIKRSAARSRSGQEKARLPGRFGVVEAVDLAGVEDGETARGAPCAVVARIVGVGFGVKGFVENDLRSGFALANLCAEFAPLLVGGPLARGVTAFVGSEPENDGVDAAIGAAALGVHRQFEALAAYAPGHGPFAGMSFDRSDEAGGDGRMNVFGRCMGAVEGWLFHE